MSTGANVLQRPGSMGWLVLGDCHFHLSTEDPVVQRMLQLVDPARQVLMLEAGPALGTGADFSEWISELIGQPLVRLDPAAENVVQIREAWLNAGLIFLIGDRQDRWREFIGEWLFQGYPEEILADSSLMIASGMSAGAMGTWMLERSGGDLVGGLGWLEGGVILPGEGQPSSESAVLELLEGMEPAYALGLPEASRLALGPNGEVEVWSDISPAIVLGRGWIDAETGA
ncbi:MAG: hypothetical protein P8X64_00975 [Anaerolineales bacterium]|jgi:hypothetical protein